MTMGRAHAGRVARRIAVVAVAALALAGVVLAICAGNTLGPDVIVVDLMDLGHYTSGGAVGGQRAYAVGTKSLNIGNQDLHWEDDTAPDWNQHPVIAQNMYRLKTDPGRPGGRLEQIGMSWLKHGFTALANNEYCLGCTFEVGHSGGDWLGQGCSDPYTASLNGTQSRLGRRSEVDAFTGAYPYTGSQPPGTGDPTLRKRLLVADADVDPAQNSGARYFVEGQYVAPDDAAADNAFNNASYREINVDANRNIAFVSDSTNRCDWDASPGTPTRTHCTIPAIYAWQAVDPTVEIVPADVPGEGRFHVAAKVHDNGDGTWRYEYAVHNLNSHRSAQRFFVPRADGLVITNAGFHDIDHHSGEPYSTADWVIDLLAGGGVEWATDEATIDPNANALRWGTMFNFWFDADAPPVAGQVTIGLFLAGTPDSIAVDLPVPSSPYAVFDDGFETGAECRWTGNSGGMTCP